MEQGYGNRIWKKAALLGVGAALSFCLSDQTGTETRIRGNGEQAERIHEIKQYIPAESQIKQYTRRR